MRPNDKVMLHALLPSVVSFIFYPAGVLLWYTRNKKRVAIIYPIILIISVTLCSIVFYEYVFIPLGRFHIRNGLSLLISYGGTLTSIFFIGRLISPLGDSKTYSLHFYNAGYTILIFNVPLWAMIMRYLLIREIDSGMAVLFISDLIMVFTTLRVQKLCPPWKEERLETNWKHSLVGIWLMATGALMGTGFLACLVNTVVR